MVIAHVSDLHLDGGSRAAERARRVHDHLAGLPGRLDAVLVSGDIADHGLPAEYAEARPLLDLPHPVLVLPGNHDTRAAFRTGLLDEPASDEPVNRVVEVGGAVFALCDSTIPGRSEGRLADETLAWLDDVLGDGPSFVCFHHPPVELHAPHLDRIRQFDEHRLAEVVRRHPGVVAVLCGHAHTAAASTFAGRPLLVAPGVVSTIQLPWEGPDVIDPAQPAAIAYHVLADDGRLTTHYRFVA
ncbi:metallophosphoesterase [Saccharothrix syringae]|uniref:Phosphodiesterase n=1 Tax=Saccharothrix syringae TaxID=103733 RepID=A0A5Q0H1C6_SACSY|nr:metallophosphoesterase [Saccharothrix syringae]QFZ20008.1 phosphodiesterase [Saccharothrix syringae]